MEDVKRREGRSDPGPTSGRLPEEEQDKNEEEVVL